MSEPSTELETVNVRHADGAATIELNRPQALNAWNAQFGADLLAALQAATDDEAVRAIVITGAGRAFSSGADLKDFNVDTTPRGDRTSTRRSQSATTPSCARCARCPSRCSPR